MSYQHTVKRKARKQHRCCESGKRIEKGEVYYVTSVMAEGTIRSYKQSAFCFEVGEAAVEYARHEGYPEEFYPHFGDLKEFIRSNEDFMKKYWPLETWSSFVGHDLASESWLRSLL